MGVEEAVKYFVSVSRSTTKQKFKGNNELLKALQCIEETSVRTGLCPDHITALVDVAACPVLAETVRKRLIKCLIPQSVVPEEAVLKCIAKLCTRKPSMAVQCLMLRWILVIYNYLDSREDLHAVYGVIFHFLHYRIMMPYVCHLLYLLTRKEDVRLFRVRFLIQYQKDMGAQPFLTGLLSIYRHYYPNLVHTVQTRSYKSFFPNYDRKWSAMVREVQERNGVAQAVQMSWERSLLERLHPSGQNVDLMPSRKRRKVDPIPVINSLTTKSSYRRDTLAHSLGIRPVPFVLIHSFKDVLDNLETLEFPSQIGAVLRSDTLKIVMSYTKDHIVAARFQFWVGETLSEELVECLRQKNVDRVTSLLGLLCSFEDFLQEGIPVVDMVMKEYLQTWNGSYYVTEVLQLLSRHRLCPFVVLHDNVLEPLRKLFFSSSVYFKCRVLLCLTELLKNFAANEWPRIREATDSSCSGLFGEDCEELSGMDTIIQLVQYVDRLILAACVTERHYLLFEVCVVDFIKLVSSLHKAYGLPNVILVEPRLLEWLFLSPHPVVVSGVCSVLCSYKENFSHIKELQKSGRIERFPFREEEQMIRACNQLVIDFCNALWRFRAFSSKDKESLFCWSHEHGDKENLPPDQECLSVLKHPALLPYTVRYCRKTCREPGINFSELKSMKRDVLNYLDHNHFGGLSQFIATFVRSKSTSTSATHDTGLSQISNLPTQQNISAFGF